VYIEKQFQNEFIKTWICRENRTWPYHSAMEEAPDRLKEVERKPRNAMWRVW